MGYRYNVNRSKTCSHCYGDHSILDCNKLTADGEEAVRIENLASQNMPEFNEEFARKLVIYAVANRAHAGYTEGSVYDFNKDESVSITVNEEKAAGITTYLKSGAYWRYTDEVREKIEDVVWIQDILNNEVLPLDGCTRAEWSKFREQHSSYPELYIEYNRTNTIKTYQKNEMNKARRANKKCSYCRGSGHTVRTCTQKATDLKIHHDAYKIFAYNTARALSRFGLWSGAMVKALEYNHELDAEETKLLHLQDFCRNIKFRIPELKPRHAMMSLEDRTVPILSAYDTADFIHATSAAAFAVFYPLGKSGMNSWRSRSELQISGNAYRSDITRFDFSSQHGSISCDPERENTREPQEFYPVRVSQKHIYQMIMSRHRNPQPSKDRYSAPRIEFASAGRLDQYCGIDLDMQSRGAYDWRLKSLDYHVYDLFEKKTRNAVAWELLERYVENNQDTLNKANSLSV